MKNDPVAKEKFIALHPMITRSLENANSSSLNFDDSEKVFIKSENSSQSGVSSSNSSVSTRSSNRRKTPWKRNPISITIEPQANDFHTFNNHYGDNADELISKHQTLIGDTGSSVHVLKDPIDSKDKTSRTNIKLGFANGQTMKASSLAVNKKLGKYIIAPASTENIISIQSLLELGYNLSGNKTHLFIHPPEVEDINFTRIRPDQVSFAFLKHTDGIYRVSIDDLKASLDLSSLHLN